MRDLKQKLELEHELELDQIKQKETSHQDNQVYISLTYLYFDGEIH